MTSISTAGFGIKSIQRGQTSLASDSYSDVSITSVNMSKSLFSAVSRSGYGTSTAVTGVDCATVAGGYLQASDNVQLYGGRPRFDQTTENAVLYWEVVEYA